MCIKQHHSTDHSIILKNIFFSPWYNLGPLENVEMAKETKAVWFLLSMSLFYSPIILLLVSLGKWGLGMVILFFFICNFEYVFYFILYDILISNCKC